MSNRRSDNEDIRFGNSFRPLLNPNSELFVDYDYSKERVESAKCATRHGSGGSIPIIVVSLLVVVGDPQSSV